MLLFLKAQMSSLVATMVDFFMTIVMVEVFKQHYISAGMVGAVAGAVTNFSINRQWTFNSKKESIQTQTMRYTLIWIGSLILNISGLYFLTHFLNVKYIISKVVTSIIVGVSFNYFFQKKYVFSVK